LTQETGLLPVIDNDDVEDTLLLIYPRGIPALTLELGIKYNY